MFLLCCNPIPIDFLKLFVADSVLKLDQNDYSFWKFSKMEEKKDCYQDYVNNFYIMFTATQRAAPPPSQASTTAAAIPPDPLFNLRQPFQHPPYDYLQSGFMHGHPFAGYPAAQGHQAFQGSAAPGFPGSLQQGFGYPGSTLPSHGAPRSK